MTALPAADGLADADVLVDRLQVWGIADGLVDGLSVQGVADGLASKGRQYLVGGK